MIKCRMKKIISHTQASKTLAKVPMHVSFWLCTNEQLRSLDELAVALLRVNDEIFRYHVNRDKNDFETWIRDIINDRELAREISRIKTKQTLVRKITERVEELRKSIKKSKRAKKAVKRKRKAKQRPKKSKSRAAKKIKPRRKSRR